MRDAARSGWNGSKASDFSPTPDELQRLPGDGADGKRRAAARIAIHLGQDDAGDAELLVELVGRFHRVLPGHGVGHEQDFDRIQQCLQLLQLVHQLIVDVQAAGGIDQQNVAAGVRPLRGAPSAPDRRARSLPACRRRWES